MKRTLLAITAFAFTSMASAINVTIDNFNSPDVGPISAALGATTAFADAVRSGSITVLAGPADGNGATLKIGSGTFPVGLLEVANASGRNSEINLAWSVAAGLLPVNAINIGFFMEVVQSDGNPTNLEFFLNNVSLSMHAIAGNTSNQVVNFGLTPAEIVTLAGGGVLGLKVTGADGWDLTADQFGFRYDLPASTPVPEPTSLALVGLALAAAGAASRRKA